MPLVSGTRLRLRSLRYLPIFIWHAQRSQRQAKAADGNHGVLTRKTRGLAFWTLSLWQDERAMAAYRAASPHREAMSRLAHWCDEAAVAHKQQESETFPTWDVAAARLSSSGRLSRVAHPSVEQKAGCINKD